MADKTSIEWTDTTWNPVTGCTEVSPGCDHCYAKTFAERWRGTPGHHFERGFDVVLREERLDQPLRWKRPRRIFVNSMSDLFHDEIPDDFVARVFAVMALADHHTFQLLTKRHGRLRSLLGSDRFRTLVEEAIPGVVAAHRPTRTWYESWPLPNVWIGVSVEDQKRADLRIPALLATPAAVRFLSCEPLLGPVDLGRYVDPKRDCNCSVPAMEGAGQHAASCRCLEQPEISWVIVGGESGHGARPMHPGWVRGLREECTTYQIPFLFKQWGEYAPSEGRVARQDFLWLDGEHTRRPASLRQIAPCRKAYVADSVPAREGWVNVERVGKGRAGRVLDGRTWDEFPEAVKA